MRIWQVDFQVYKSISELPRPLIVVEEVQDHPSYKCVGANRKGDMTCQIVCTLEGEGRFRHGDREHVLRPGTAFLAQHCDAATSYYYPPEGDGTAWRFIWTAFCGGTVPKIVNSIVKNYGYIFKLPVERGLIKELEAYRAYRNAIRIFTPLAGAKYVMDALAYLDESASPDKDQLSRSDQLREAQTFIIENLSGNMSVGDVAARMKMSREHFTRIFKEHTDISPNRYILKEKMKLSCHLLKETQMDCKEIAARIGYENAASFTRVFRKEVRMTPGEFRIRGHIPGLF